MREETILRTVAFDPALKLYWLIQGAWIMLVTVVCVPLLPFWLLGLGQLSSANAYKRLECQLTTRSLHLRKGWIFRVERTIPLDKIQDLAMHEGPILRAMGLSVIKVETAGQSGQSGSDAVLVGVIDAPAFRDAVLEQRDRVTETSRGGAVAAAPVPQAAELAVLEEIRDSLVRIEGTLRSRES